MDHDIQEILNFDHIYTCHTENVEISSENALHSVDNDQTQNEIMQLTVKLNNSQNENTKLKDLILIHLDIIQQQDDEIIRKNKEIATYQREIAKLKSSLNQVDDNSINLHVQNLNPPPLIHLTTSGQSVPTVTLIPESTSQVQFTNIANILNATTTLDNVITQKTPEKKIEPTEAYIESISCANVGSIIDTRYLQCTDSVFDPQTNICFQNIVQPLVQTSIHSISQPIVTTIQTGTTNSLRLKTIHLKNIPAATVSTPIQINQNKARQKSTGEFIVAKDSSTKGDDTPFLTFNKKLKTIFTYEKNSKRHTIKKVVKNTDHADIDISGKILKSRDISQKEKLNSDSFTLSNSPGSNKLQYKYTLLNNRLSTKSDHEYTSNNLVVEKIQNKPNTVKPVTTRKFFTSSHKEKTSCRDFSYGESLANIDYKSNILEYLEGNNSNSQGDSQLDLDWKDDLSNISNLSPHYSSPPDVSRKKITKDSFDISDVISKTSPNFASGSTHQEKNSESKFFTSFMANQQYSKMSRSSKSKSKTRPPTTQPSESQLTQANPSVSGKTNTNTNSKKKSVKRARALSSASKVSTVSQSESPVPSSWSFSGQDFNILTADVKFDYFTSTFGSNQSYFSMSQMKSKEPATETTSLEVPSWRIKTYTSDESTETTENVDEEIYLKRHLKMENEEKRRKRWDFQMIREQRHIERLKQRQERRNSSGVKHRNKVVCSTSGEELPSSFYPSPDEVLEIHVSDTLPVTAFGECIPDLPARSFQLPWIRSCSHSHSRSHSSSKKKIKSSKSDEE